MEQLYQYFLKNFFLICLSFGVIFMVLRGYRVKRVVVLMPILIVSSAVLLSIAYAVEVACLPHPELVFLATFCFFLGFAIRPLVLYFFLRIQITNRIILRIAVGLIIANAVIYAMTLFINVPQISHLVYWYQDEGGSLVHHRGPLYFASYFIVGIMMAYLVFISLASLKGPRRKDALASLICVAFIGLAVLLETLLVADSLLNTTIVIACLFYIVHLYQQASNKDGLTNLFDRKTFYADRDRFGARVHGVILVDMNSLKLINDTQGHAAGDSAIIAIAQTMQHCAKHHNVFIYRMGGDEFLAVSLSEKEHLLEDMSGAIKEEMKKTPYSVSIGFAYKENSAEPLSIAMKKAEEMMYDDKAEYYRITGIERRRH